MRGRCLVAAFYYPIHADLRNSDDATQPKVGKAIQLGFCILNPDPCHGGVARLCLGKRILIFITTVSLKPLV